MKYIAGVISGIILVLGGGYLVAKSGRISVAATQHGGLYDKVDDFLASVSDKSVRIHAPRESNPFARDAAAAAEGLVHYKFNCMGCHGAGPIDSAEFAKGMNPNPPMLDMKDSQEMSDGEMFWVVSHGIRSTGMPAFSPTHTPQEIWKIVSFVRHLPKLTPEEIQALKAGMPSEAEHHQAPPASAHD